MKENKNHITDMQQLAEAGWKQMHEMLTEHGLSDGATELVPASKKENTFLRIAACVMFLLLFSCPFILNDKYPASLNPLSEKQNSYLPLMADNTPIKPASAVNALQQSSKEKKKLSEKLTNDFLKFKKEQATLLQPDYKAFLLQKISTGKISPITKLTPQVQEDTVGITNTMESQSLPVPPKNKSSLSKKVQLFAGVGINVAESNKSNSFNFSGVNIHPGFTVKFPLAKKLSLHTGLWAFSTVHGKEVSSKERQVVNNLATNVYYNINTTSIIKASFFDVPVTLHYSITDKWSVGSGLQLSKLYKINIKEQKESFDYSNTLFSATIDQFNSTPSRAAAVFQRKVEIKKYEPRLVAETNFQYHNWLFSAGYYYGLGKTVTLKGPDNTSHQYRNEYFKLGIEYRIIGR